MKIKFNTEWLGCIEGQHDPTKFKEGEIREVGIDIDESLAKVALKLKAAEKYKGFKKPENKLIMVEENKVLPDNVKNTISLMQKVTRKKKRK